MELGLYIRYVFTLLNIITMELGLYIRYVFTLLNISNRPYYVFLLLLISIKQANTCYVFIFYIDISLSVGYFNQTGLCCVFILI